jgi:dihydrofolate synthase/folylpolyglutamate synthase
MVAEILGRHGCKIAHAAIVAGIGSTRLPGRLELMPGTVKPAIWVDGAHNEDKIRAATREAIGLSKGGPLPVIVFGLLRSKDPSSIFAQLGTAASRVIVTEPSVHGKASRSAEALARELSASGFAGAIHVEPEPDNAVRYAEAIARREGAPLLVTGSMYLAGQVRRRWFKDEDIVLQRTPWPTVSESPG